jgi:hypothetical protein
MSDSTNSNLSTRLGRPRTASLSVTPITLPNSIQLSRLTKIVFIKVDELDEKPRLIRLLSDPTPRKFLHICDNTDCSTVDSEMKLCAGCKYNRYCSSECQKHDWWNHKDVCRQTCIGCKKVFKEFALTENVKYNGHKWILNFCEDCELSKRI